MILQEENMTTRPTEKYSALTRRVLVLGALFVLSLQVVTAQIIRGAVTDKENGRPVPGVFISINDGTLNLQSSEDGTYMIEGLDAGRYTLVFQHVQYAPLYIEVQLSLAQEAVVNAELDLRTIALPEVTVPGANFTRKNALYQITAEETQRYPGTFFDPARFAVSFPGVQTVNDQANQLVINGMSPDLMQWRLEGLEGRAT